MVLKNTLFKKGYLLAGVMMAANMFIVNEMKAMEIENMDINFNQDRSINTGKKASPLGLKFVLTYENYINFIGGLVFSGLNNYFKWWNYDAGGYRQFGCFGWRSGRFIKDIFQFEVNFINLGRGAFWLIATFLGSYKCLKKQIMPRKLTCTAAVIMNSWEDSWPVKPMGIILFFFLSILQGFVSMPLTFNISNFSISISLDSIIWELAKLSTIVMVNMGKEQVKKNELNDDNKIDLFLYNNEEGDNENNKNNNEEQ